ncbi:MAG: hypothetical protein LBE78_09965 [Burkholderiaceae bacterium]|nr:hypothetical protein [Burkholderiaceae bacterium]
MALAFLKPLVSDAALFKVCRLVRLSLGWLSLPPLKPAARKNSHKPVLQHGQVDSAQPNMQGQTVFFMGKFSNLG